MKNETVVGDIDRRASANYSVISANAGPCFASGVAVAIHTAAGPALEAFRAPHSPPSLGRGRDHAGLPARQFMDGACTRTALPERGRAPETHCARAIRSAMEMVRAHCFESVAVPPIGTDALRFRPILAASIMDRVVRESILPDSSLRWLRVSDVNAPMPAILEYAFNALLATGGEA